MAALNQYLERDRDRLMSRTTSRPLPAGKLSSWQALCFASISIVLAELIFLMMVSWLPAALGALVVVFYDWIYTSLKAHAWWSTLAGAVPGALPAVIGWSAVQGRLGAPALILFAIVFLWQLPHVLAIARLHRAAYRRAGIHLLPVDDGECALTSWEMALVSVLLVPVSLLPTLVGMTGELYLLPAIVLGFLYVRSTVGLAKDPTQLMARGLLRLSVVYLPLLLAAMFVFRNGV